jgi:hypothetical protein
VRKQLLLLSKSLGKSLFIWLLFAWHQCNELPPGSSRRSSTHIQIPNSSYSLYPLLKLGMWYRKWLCFYDISKQYFPKSVAFYSNLLFSRHLNYSFISSKIHYLLWRQNSLLFNSFTHA